MWGRSVEVMLGLWLVISPFLFGHYGEQGALTRSDLAAGTAVVAIACTSCFRRFERLHLLNLAVAAWLVGHGYLGYPHPAPPGAQNEILVGLVLVLIAIIPPDPSEPPRPWRRFLEAQERGDSSG